MNKLDLIILGSSGGGDNCTVNLDQLTGKYPPLLTQNSNFVFPSSESADGVRYLTFRDGDNLYLYCHGSLRYQDSTTVKTSDGVDTGRSKLSLACNNGQFQSVVDQVTKSSMDQDS